MSWIDKIQNIRLEIITGDGKHYFPLWKNAKKQIGYNLEQYEFINVEGSYIDKKLPLGVKYPFIFWFQGEDNLDQVDNFILSANDTRPWLIRHPLYGDIRVQIIEMNIDNSLMNATEIQGVFIETLERKYPAEYDNQKELIFEAKFSTDEIIKENFPTDIDTGVIELSKNSINSISQTYEKNCPLDYVNDLKDKIRQASASAGNISNNAVRYINTAIDLINFPFQIEQNIRQKIDYLIEAMTNLKNIFVSVGTEIFEQSLKVYESNVSTLISTACISSIETTDEYGYSTSDDVLAIIDLIAQAYDNFLTTFDDNENFFIDHRVALKLDYIVNLTIGNLFNIAFEQKQKRSLVLEKDDNIINLCHRFYGFGEENLNKFIEQNNISLEEYIYIRKGRTIVYFV